MARYVNLPEGFVIDKKQSYNELPEGFIIDNSGRQGFDTLPSGFILDKVKTENKPLTFTNEALEEARKNTEQYNNKSYLKDIVTGGLSGFGQGVKLGSENAINGATLGAYGWLNKKLGGDFNQRAEDFKKEGGFIGNAGMLASELGSNVYGGGKLALQGAKGGLNLLSKGLKYSPKIANGLKRMAKGGKALSTLTGAIEGGAYGFNNSEGNLKEASLGALTGGVGGFGSDLVGSGIHKLGRSMKINGTNKKFINFLKDVSPDSDILKSFFRSKNTKRSLIEAGEDSVIRGAIKAKNASKDAYSILSNKSQAIRNGSELRAEELINEVLDGRIKNQTVEEILSSNNAKANRLYSRLNEVDDLLDFGGGENKIDELVSSLKNKEGLNAEPLSFKTRQEYNDELLEIAKDNGIDLLGDINHFTKDSKRSRYIGTLPETFNNPDFSSMKDLKSYLTKKYKDEKGKAFYDLIVKKGNSVYNKFPAKSPNYVAKYLKEPFDNMPINGNINNVLGDSPTSLNNNIIPQEKYIINNNGKVSRASTPQVSTKDNLVGITGNTPSQLDQNNIIISHNFDKVKKLEEVLSLKRIQEEISKVVNDSEFELRLGKKPNQRSFGVLNEVKKNLDDTIKNRFSQTEIEGGKRIEEYKNMLIDAMDEVLDGKNGRPDYKAARQHSGDKIRIENILGVHSGKSEAMNTVFNSSMFPKQFVSHYRDLKIPEREAFRVAVRNDMLGQLGRYKTDTTAINQFLTSNTKDKLRLALSKGKTNRLTDFFEQERRATNNINKILGGSQTYEKQALSDAFLSGDLKGASFNFLKKLFKGRMSDKRAELAAKVFSKPTDKNLIKDLKRMRILKLRGKEEALLPGFIGGKFGDETSSN